MQILTQRSCLTLIVVSCHLFMHVRVDINLGHECFLPCPFRFINHPVIRCY
jgi:hypothetical protein